MGAARRGEHDGGPGLTGDIATGEQARVNHRSSTLFLLTGGSIDPVGPACHWVSSVLGFALNAVSDAVL